MYNWSRLSEDCRSQKAQSPSDRDPVLPDTTGFETALRVKLVDVAIKDSSLAAARTAECHLLRILTWWFIKPLQTHVKQTGPLGLDKSILHQTPQGQTNPSLLMKRLEANSLWMNLWEWHVCQRWGLRVRLAGGYRLGSCVLCPLPEPGPRCLHTRAIVAHSAEHSKVLFPPLWTRQRHVDKNLPTWYKR